MEWLQSLLWAVGGGIVLAIVNWLTGGAVVNIMIAVARWVATKALVYLLIFTVIPVVFYNILQDFVFDAIQWGLNYIGASGFAADGLVVQLSGIAGYIAVNLGLPSMFSMIMSAVAIKFVLGFVRM